LSFASAKRTKQQKIEIKTKNYKITENSSEQWLVTSGLCLPEREEGTVVVVAVAESRALKQAKKHPIAEVREKDRRTNLGVEPKQQQQQHYPERVLKRNRSR